jgi:thiol:disulfide interchange protein DsbC
VSKRILLAVLLGLVGLTVQADEQADVANIKKVFAKIVPGETPEMISPSVMPNIYEVVYGSQVMYVSADGRYLIQGDLYDLNTRENLSENIRVGQRLKVVQDIDPASTIIFKPKGKSKHVLTVFTDIDCGYCRKLHNQMNQYLAAGIEVRYLAFPRSGVNTKSYYKAVSVWCADDRQAAMTDAKNGGNPPRKECDNPVQEHMQLAEQFGVSGTPTLVLDNGEVIPGYIPPDRLAKMLNEGKQAAM